MPTNATTLQWYFNKTIKPKFKAWWCITSVNINYFTTLHAHAFLYFGGTKNSWW